VLPPARGRGIKREDCIEIRGCIHTSIKAAIKQRHDICCSYYFDVQAVCRQCSAWRSEITYQIAGVLGSGYR
jgi:hypothetical protein